MNQDISRQVEDRVLGRATQDGAGVQLRRVLTGQWHVRLDPWLMLDEFSSANPDDYVAGFPPHPHRGFETITYMLAGRMEHGDNQGNRGVVEAGGMQWMRAGRGIVHSEMPAQTAGLMRGFQFWLNLPASDKLSDPVWADVPAADLPVWRSDEVSVKVLAGEFAGLTGPLQRVASQPLLLDVSWRAEVGLFVPIVSGHHAFVYVHTGAVQVGGTQVSAGEMAVLSNDAQARGVALSALAESGALVAAGRPLREPIAAGGPFVMNTQDELAVAFDDYRAGRF